MHRPTLAVLFSAPGLAPLTAVGSDRQRSSNSDDLLLPYQVAKTGQFPPAIGRHLIWQLDGYAVNQENQDTRFGVRSEFLVKF